MLERKRRLERYDYLLYLIVFFMIVMDSSFYAVNHIEGFLRVAADILVAFIIPIIKMKLKINKNDALICLFVIGYFVLNGLIFSTLKQTIILSTFVISALIIKSSIDKEELIQKYCDILLCLSIFSLIVYFIYIVSPSVIQLLPRISRGNGRGVYYNAFFSVICFSNVKRNYGIFWEPGAFAVYLNIALFFELFCKRIDLRRITLLTITIITTLSTTGIVCALILYISGLFKSTNNMNKYLKAFIFSALLASSIYLLIDGDYFIDHVFGKLSGISYGSAIQTTEVRINSIKYPGKLFVGSPIIGCGFNKYLIAQDIYCLGMATCTFINWLAIYGLIGGLVLIAGVIVFFCKNGENVAIKFLVTIFSVLLFSTENYIQIMFIYVLFIYGISDLLRIKVKQSNLSDSAPLQAASS